MFAAFVRSLVVVFALSFAAIAAEGTVSPAPGQPFDGKPQLALPSLSETGAVDFDLPQPVLDLGPSVSARKVPDPGSPTGAWFTLGVQNRGTATVARVLAASEPPAGGLQPYPMVRRPALIEAASPDADIVIESTTAFGENAFRILVPPGKATTLALHFEGVPTRPAL